MTKPSLDFHKDPYRPNRAINFPILRRYVLAVIAQSIVVLRSFVLLFFSLFLSLSPLRIVALVSFYRTRGDLITGKRSVLEYRNATKDASYLGSIKARCHRIERALARLVPEHDNDPRK